MTTDFREPLREKGAARYGWRTELNENTLDERWAARKHSVIHRQFRLVCGLSQADVAQAYGMAFREVSELEQMLRLFPDRRDLWAALNQLWLMRRGEP